MIKWPSSIYLGYWPYTVYYAVNILNNTPGPSGFLPKEIFTGIKEDRNLKHFYTFESLVCILNPILASSKKLLTWKPCSKPSVFISKSRQHTTNVSLVHNLSTNFINLQFHIVHDNNFQTVTSANLNSLLKN